MTANPPDSGLLGSVNAQIAELRKRLEKLELAHVPLRCHLATFDPATRCVRCGAPYAPEGSCSKRNDKDRPCQGGRGENPHRKFLAGSGSADAATREDAAKEPSGSENKPSAQPEPGQINQRCRACGKTLVPENLRVADGCPCNSARGINHGLVPKATCTCAICDPAQTGSTRYPIPVDQPEPSQDSPPFTPSELKEFAARDFVRSNRVQPEASQVESAEQLEESIRPDAGWATTLVVGRIRDHDAAIRGNERRQHGLSCGVREDIHAKMCLRAEKAEAERDALRDHIDRGEDAVAITQFQSRIAAALKMVTNLRQLATTLQGAENRTAAHFLAEQLRAALTGDK